MRSDKKRYALILASGSGTRTGGGVPKQFRCLGGIPAVCHAIGKFRDSETVVVLVINGDAWDLWRGLEASLPPGAPRPDRVVQGGETRRESVRLALGSVPQGRDILVAVHDGARPLLTRDLVERAWKAAETGVAVVPAVPLADSIRVVNADGSVPEDRSRYRAVQTPQIAPAEWLRRAYSLPESPLFTDDASMLQVAGYPLRLIEGERRNIKITWPDDFIIAEALIRNT